MTDSKISWHNRLWFGLTRRSERIISSPWLREQSVSVYQQTFAYWLRGLRKNDLAESVYFACECDSQPAGCGLISLWHSANPFDFILIDKHLNSDRFVGLFRIEAICINEQLTSEHAGFRLARKIAND